MDPNSHEALGATVVAAQRGDPGAWTHIVQAFQDRAVAIAAATTGDWDAARDVAQDAFGEAFRSLGGLRDPQAFTAWFTTVVRSAGSRRLRRRELTTAPLDDADALSTSHAGPEAVVVAADEARRVRAAVESLPVGERAVVALHYLGDFSYPEVADFLGITPAAAKKRAHSARRRLEELYAMDTDTVRDARPSRTTTFRDHVLLFRAIRERDVATVTDLLRRDPDLVHATEGWSLDEAIEANVDFVLAGRASPLIRAAQTGDLDLVRALVEAGAPVRDVCQCAGAESPLWTATVTGEAPVVEYLLGEGADPNVAAFAGATPLHVAMQRGHHHLVPALLEAGADPERVDDFGRTPADWLALRRPAGEAAPEAHAFLPTGIRALDLFAPLRRGGVQHWPPAVGLGQTVLVFAVADALRPAEFRLLGFEHGPYNTAGAANETRESGVACEIDLAEANRDPARRRAEFGRALTSCLASPAEKFVQVLEAPGHAHDVVLALPTLARDPHVATTVVVQAFDGAFPRVTAEPPEGYDGQVVFDRHRALAGLWPAIDPQRTTSRWYPSARHERLAAAARDALAGVTFAPDADVPPLARYFAQPFAIAEPFTSRPGERTPYTTLLDEVEALL
jgi:RNA polymerase sigma-70 factor (ECF subfamily)